MTLMLMPTAALAAVQTSRDQTVYLSPSGIRGVTIWADNMAASDKIKKSSVKSSNSGIVELQTLSNRTSIYETDGFTKGATTSKQTNVSADIFAIAKKAGTTTVSYQIGSKTYQTKVTVKNYVNPLSSLKISGVNSGKNIATQANKTDQVACKLKKTVKNATVTVKAKSGWKISYIGRNAKGGDGCSYSFSKGVSAVAVPVGTMTKNKSYMVTIQLENTKDKAMILVNYNINNFSY